MYEEYSQFDEDYEYYITKYAVKPRALAMGSTSKSK